MGIVLFWVLPLVTAASALTYALEKEKLRKLSGHTGKPYTWGYYCGAAACVGWAMNAVMCLCGFIVAENTEDRIFFPVAAIICVLLSVSGIFVVKRRRWAWIVVTIACGPIGWIINGIYGKNRWSEFNDGNPVSRGAIRVPTQGATRLIGHPPLPMKPTAKIGPITIAQHDQTFGPYDVAGVVDLWDQGQLAGNALYWHEQLSDWKPLASDVEALRMMAETEAIPDSAPSFRETAGLQEAREAPPAVARIALPSSSQVAATAPTPLSKAGQMTNSARVPIWVIFLVVGLVVFPVIILLVRVTRTPTNHSADIAIPMEESFSNASIVAQTPESTPAKNVTIEEIRAQAEKGDRDAQFRLGEAYGNGEGAPEDPIEAVKWWRMAAEQNHAGAQNMLGAVAKDEAEAVKWYRKAAEQDLAQAQNSLGECYYFGTGVPEDTIEAVKWLHKAAVQNHPTAQFSMGYLYQIGKGVAKDMSEAVKWYRKAAEQDNAEAQNALGDLYVLGEGVPKGPVESVKWYRKAAEKGDAKGQVNLGLSYQNGFGVAEDMGQAIHWYQKAAAQEYPQAQFHLGVCYQIGAGVAQDSVEAVNWYRRAAEQGDGAGQNNLGSCYYTGEGVAKDLIEAMKWFLLAKARGSEQSSDWISKAEKEMTPDQIAEAQRRAEEFNRLKAAGP
jgi:TPR repeat protein